MSEWLTIKIGRLSQSDYFVPGCCISFGTGSTTNRSVDFESAIRELKAAHSTL